MAGGKRHRRREWRAAGKRKAERMLWVVAIVATLLVIGATLIAGHLRRQPQPSMPTLPPGTATTASDDG